MSWLILSSLSALLSLFDLLAMNNLSEVWNLILSQFVGYVSFDSQAEKSSNRFRNLGKQI